MLQLDLIEKPSPPVLPFFPVHSPGEASDEDASTPIAEQTDDSWVPSPRIDDGKPTIHCERLLSSVVRNIVELFPHVDTCSGSENMPPYVFCLVSNAGFEFAATLPKV